ncbi:MAG: U32 family peptidase, partial [Planctomycetales bacterium]|nr:U32 family peptidase [Planctomycetales bacterium]
MTESVQPDSLRSHLSQPSPHGQLMSDTSCQNVELLAPAGDWNCVRAAAAAGADAVYFGLQTGFNARARAHNFPLDDLAEVMTFLRRQGMRGYVTLNTLVFTSELRRIEAHARQLIDAGVDAVLVQDLGLARLLVRLCPDLSIHASTQMTLTSSQAIEVARRLGIARVVLARELSIDEIRAIRKESDIEVETFVHGALCVAYSGQCLTSESLGGRSANRGECAQACRLNYQLVCDGQDVDLGDQQYLLSPQDLAAYALIPDLIAAGVHSFKIEGRLKTPEYVANITSHYRRAIDAALANQPFAMSTMEIDEMELSFSRGFTPGWLEGCDHKRLVPGLTSAKQGIRLGEIEAIRGDRVRIRLERSIKRGDGVVFREHRVDTAEQGGRVYEVFVRGRSLTDPVNSGLVDLTFAHGALDFSRLRPGQTVWKNDDPELNRRLRKQFAGTKTPRRIELDVHVTAIAGQPLHVTARSSNGQHATYLSPEPLPVARNRPVDEAELRQQIDRLGQTDYRLGPLTITIEGEPMVPRSVSSAARHAIVEQLDAAIQACPTRAVTSDCVVDQLRAEINLPSLSKVTEPQLHVLARDLPQLEYILSLGVDSVYADFADIRQYRTAVTAARQSTTPIYLATPRIQKPAEEGMFRAMARYCPDGFLIRNLAGLLFCEENQLAMIGDFSLNTANELTMHWLHDQGVQRITASYDLNRDQLGELAAQVPGPWLEVVIHQHMPMFHMEHCVFCAVLSPGTNKHNCGRPCDTHQVQLRDR